MLDIALLGTGGMMPLPHRFLSSMICRYNGRLLLIDCGEGTQVTNKLLGWGFKNIDTICFTHVHGDHITGLPGMLLTIGNSGRIEPLTIVGPIGIKFIASSLMVIATDLPFDVNFIEVEDFGEKITIGDFNINTIKLDHRVTCIGYSIEINRVGKFNKALAQKNNVPITLWGKLQKKETVTENNITYTPNMVMGDDRKGIKISFVTDTRPIEGLSDFVRESDLFICEGLYGDNDKQSNAAKYKHMIFSEAATIGKEANVEEIWLTHFSPALTEPEEFLSNATDIFSNTKIGYDRISTTIKFQDIKEIQ